MGKALHRATALQESRAIISGLIEEHDTENAVITCRIRTIPRCRQLVAFNTGGLQQE